MTRTIQILRGTTAQNNAYTGSVGELTMDTDKKTVRIHDGSTQGGHELVSVSKLNSSITNCITEIPQDINLEIFDDNGTKKVRLKAGSKLYVPAGSGTFNTVTTTTDIVCQGTGETGTTMVFYRMDGEVWGNITLSDCTSGTTTPNFGMFYNTSTNKINFYNGGVIAAVDDFSFPIAIITVNSGNVTSINQVFNGFGYIGSTVFALPGVKGLIPDGRNADGTLNSTPYTINEVTTLTFSSSYTHNDVECGFLSGSTSANYYTYNEPENFNYIGTTKTRRPMNCVVSVSNGKITSFMPKLAFHSVDYSDTDFIAHQGTPSNRYKNLTLGATGTFYTAPADGFIIIEGTSTSAYSYILLGGSTCENTSSAYAPRSGAYISATIAVRKNMSFGVWYDTITAGRFRFYYANGAQ